MIIDWCFQISGFRGFGLGFWFGFLLFVFVFVFFSQINTQIYVNGRETMQTHCNKQELKLIVNNGTKCQKTETASCSLMDGGSSVITCQQGKGLDSQVLSYSTQAGEAK